jgi:hypothetical protein
VRARFSVLVAVVAMLTVSAVAIAAVKPLRHTAFFYLAKGHFSITLDTNAARQIAAGRLDLPRQFAVSGILLVCPASASPSVSELLLGFPGAKFKLTRGLYRFTLSYTWKHARVNVISGAGSGTHTFLKSARVRVTGTVASARLITGKVSVVAKGCNLPSSTYQASFFRTVPN